MRIYFAAPFTFGPYVLKLHERARELGHEPTSSWANVAHGNPEQLAALTPAGRREIIRQNDSDVERADMLVAVLVAGQGKEMFCETTLARFRGMPICWMGPDRAMPLSAYRRGSMRVPDETHLLAVLRDLTGEGAAERLLASLEQI